MQLLRSCAKRAHARTRRPKRPRKRPCLKLGFSLAVTLRLSRQNKSDNLGRYIIQAGLWTATHRMTAHVFCVMSGSSMRDRCWSSLQSSLVKHHPKQAPHASQVAGLQSVVTKAVWKKHISDRTKAKTSSFAWGIVESETMRRTPVPRYPSYLDGTKQSQ